MVKGMPGMPPFVGGKGACNMQGGSGFGLCGAHQGNAFQGPPGFFSKVKDLRCLQMDLVFQ